MMQRPGGPLESRRLCALDLDAAHAFVRANDAGAQLAATPAEVAAREADVQQARELAETAANDVEGTTIIQKSLLAWRKGHLFVELLDGGNATKTLSGRAAALPSAESLSPDTALLTIPSFFPGARHRLAEVLHLHRPMLENRRCWIIDVRGNDGGADTTYAPLLPWLMPEGWLSVSDRIYVTAANIEAEECVCDLFAPGDPDCIRFTQEAVRRMRSVQAGQWVQQEYEAGWRHERPAAAESRRPDRVAVLFDSGCGSSCEQFLLTVRQSFSVKLVGRGRSCGALDASNLRPHTLPSGRRRLWYATTLSNRLPAMPIDGIGVSPDVLLPSDGQDHRGRAEVGRVQGWLEGAGW